MKSSKKELMRRLETLRLYAEVLDELVCPICDERAEVVMEIGEIKQKLDLPVRNRGVERRKLAHHKAKSRHPDYVGRCLQAVMDISCDVQEARRRRRRHRTTKPK